jgi:hypothetical protein
LGRLSVGALQRNTEGDDAAGLPLVHPAMVKRLS